MKRLFFFALALLQGGIAAFSQNSLLTDDFKLFKAGAGVTAYMNNLFLPAGMTGVNLGSAVGGRNIRSSARGKSRIIDYSVSIDYSRLMNRNGENSLIHPTELYKARFYADELLPVTRPGNGINFFAGAGAGFNAGLCLNDHFTFRSLYYTPFYNEWNVFAGIALLINCKIKNLTFEDKFTMPVLLLGSWPEYGISPDTRSISGHIRSIQFNTLTRYANPENHLTMYYSRFRLFKKPMSIFLSWFLDLHSSDIDGVIQRYSKNAIYAGLIISRPG